MQKARLTCQQAKLTDQDSAKTGKEKIPARVMKGFWAGAPRTATLEVPPARLTALRSTGHSRVQSGYLGGAWAKAAESWSAETGQGVSREERVWSREGRGRGAGRKGAAELGQP